MRDDPEANSDDRGAFSKLVRMHLRTVASARLFVGTHLDKAHWKGLNAHFGALIDPYASETILAVYDDSAFGRGSKGFVITDAAVYHSSGQDDGRVALADVRSVQRTPGSIVLAWEERDEILDATVLRVTPLAVDEYAAFSVVRTFFEAVAEHNASVRLGDKPSWSGAGRETEGTRATTQRPAFANDLPLAYARLADRHLAAFPAVKLYAGTRLVEAPWEGVNQVFGPLLAPFTDETILAVYDDTAFGRGSSGIVVTDAALYQHQMVEGGSKHERRLALAEVTAVNRYSVYSVDEMLFVSLRDGMGPRGTQRNGTVLRVPASDARAALHAFLEAVAAANRVAGNPPMPLTANGALDRLDDLSRTGRLEPAHLARLRTLLGCVSSDPADPIGMTPST